jgi:hypothetical protein
LQSFLLLFSCRIALRCANALVASDSSNSSHSSSAGGGGSSTSKGSVLFPSCTLVNSPWLRTLILARGVANDAKVLSESASIPLHLQQRLSSIYCDNGKTVGLWDNFSMQGHGALEGASAADAARRFYVSTLVAPDICKLHAAAGPLCHAMGSRGMLDGQEEGRFDPALSHALRWWMEEFFGPPKHQHKLLGYSPNASRGPWLPAAAAQMLLTEAAYGRRELAIDPAILTGQGAASLESLK